MTRWERKDWFSPFWFWPIRMDILFLVNDRVADYRIAKTSQVRLRPASWSCVVGARLIYRAARRWWMYNIDVSLRPTVIQWTPPQKQQRNSSAPSRPGLFFLPRTWNWFLFIFKRNNYTNDGYICRRAGVVLLKNRCQRILPRFTKELQENLGQVWRTSAFFSLSREGGRDIEPCIHRHLWFSPCLSCSLCGAQRVNFKVSTLLILNRVSNSIWGDFHILLLYYPCFHVEKKEC